MRALIYENRIMKTNRIINQVMQTKLHLFFIGDVIEEYRIKWVQQIKGIRDFLLL